MTAEDRALAACLAAGHCLADFVLQTRWMVDRKHRASGLLAHGAVVAVSTLVTLLPFAGRSVVLAAAALTGAPVILDAIKSAAVRRAPDRSLECFVLDQLGHLGLLAVAWLWLVPRVPPVAAAPLDARGLGTVALLVAGYAFNLNGMSAIVIAVLARLGMETPGNGGPPVGRVIGFLERVFALTLILMDRWEALGLLVAAKSLARFKELDQRARAEYYLVGTLVSLLGATLTALLLRKLL